MKKFSLLFLLTASILFLSCGEDDEGTEIDRQIEAELFALINSHRANMGLDPFTRNVFMDDLARGHSKDMADANAILFNEGFSGRTEKVVQELGPGDVAENEASFQGVDKAAGIFNTWLSSNSHRAVIEGDFFQTGLAVAKSEFNIYYATQIFWKG